MENWQQYDSVMGEDNDEDAAIPYTIGSKRGSISTDGSYSKQLADVLGSDEERNEWNGMIDDEVADEVAELRNGRHQAGETSILTEAGSSTSTISHRPKRPWQYPAPRRLRSLRAEHTNTSIDSPSLMLSASPSIVSDEGSGRMSWMLPYGEPLLNGVSNGINGHPDTDRSGKTSTILHRSFLRMHRLCTLNDREGSPTVMATAGSIIVVGTEEGKVGIFERNRGWMGVISVEGVVTALALSSDTTFVAVGTSLGHIFLYDVSKTNAPARHVPPVVHQAVAQGRSEGHLQGSKILHLGFVGLRHTAIVSADEHGLSFYHSLGKILGVSSNDTLRILGRYPDLVDDGSSKKSTVLCMAALPLGPIQHASDANSFVALLTPSKMVLVGLKPSARTWYRSLAPERSSTKFSGCLAWLPCTKGPSANKGDTIQPTLAFAFGQHLRFIRLITTGSNSAAQVTIQEVKGLVWTHTDPIEAMQWLSPDYLVLYSQSKLSLFDVRKGKCTEEQATIKPVCNDWLETSTFDALPFAIGSFKVQKGLLFVLTPSEVLVASLVSWADRILALVSKGDFLGAIQSATLLLQDQGDSSGSRVGLPEAFADQKPIIASRLMELMKASTRYVFSEDRMKDDMSEQRGGVDRTPLFEGLAKVCAEACLALQDFTFLFDELFDMYSDAGIEAIFADQMEEYIVNGQLRILPLPVVQRLISVRKRQERYDLAERIIWNVDPTCLDLDQAIRLCLDQRLYDALIYIYTRALHDFVGPIVELMPLIRKQDGEAYRIMSYLSITFIGLSYPNQEKLEDKEASLARSSIYSFLFSGRCVIWPPGPGGKLILTHEEEEDFAEPTFPYLSMLSRFDAEAFLDVLDGAFEDAWLDEGDMTRQTIISILYEMVEMNQVGRVFIAIFIARNAPKYPQFIKLSSTQVQKLLSTLSTTPEQDEDDDEEDRGTLDDREYAVECLLSAYRPPQTDAMLDRFEKAGFVDILRRIYRSEGKWTKLAQNIVAGPHNDATIDGVNEVLRKGKKDIQLQSIILHALPALVDVDVRQTVMAIQQHIPSRQKEAIHQLDRSPHRQLLYIKELLDLIKERDAKVDDEISNQYISLICSLEPHSLAGLLDNQPQDYSLAHVIEVSREESVIEGVLWARDRLGETKDAFKEADQYIAERQLVLRNAESDAEEEEAKEQVRGVVDMAIRICSEKQEEDLWMDVMRMVIRLTHDLRDRPSSSFSRMLLEDTLSSFVSSASADTASFSHLFRKLVADSNGYAEVKVISDGMMAANRLRQELLSITNRLFDRDVHRELVQLTQRQRAGWRPSEANCSGCNLPILGGGVGGGGRRKQIVRRSPTRSPRPDKGKGVIRGDDSGDFFSSDDPFESFTATPIKDASVPNRDDTNDIDEYSSQEEEEDSGTDVLVCNSGNVWHRRCAPSYLY